MILDAGLIKGVEEGLKLTVFIGLWVVSFIISLIYCFVFKSEVWTSEYDKAGYPIFSFLLFLAKSYLFTNDKLEVSLKMFLLIDVVYIILLYITTVIEIYKWNDPFAGCSGKGGGEPLHTQIFKEFGDYGD